MTLTRQVEIMVDKKLRLESLLGHVLATMQINIERGYIVAVNDEGKLNLADIMARWKREFDELTKDIGATPCPSCGWNTGQLIEHPDSCICSVCLTRNTCPNPENDTQE